MLSSVSSQQLTHYSAAFAPRRLKGVQAHPWLDSPDVRSLGCIITRAVKPLADFNLASTVLNTVCDVGSVPRDVPDYGDKGQLTELSTIEGKLGIGCGCSALRICRMVTGLSVLLPARCEDSPATMRSRLKRVVDVYGRKEDEDDEDNDADQRSARGAL